MRHGMAFPTPKAGNARYIQYLAGFKAHLHHKQSKRPPAYQHKMSKIVSKSHWNAELDLVVPSSDMYYVDHERYLDKLA